MGTTTATTTTTIISNRCTGYDAAYSTMSPTDDDCADVAAGGTCTVTLTSTDSNDLMTECVNADAATTFLFYCPWDAAGGSNSLIVSDHSFRCQTCGDITFEDEDEDGGELEGTLCWGPNLKTTSAQVPKHDVQSTCCNDMEYSVDLAEEIPADAVAIKISPYKGSVILPAGRILYFTDNGGTMGSASGVSHAEVGVVTYILSIVACVATLGAVN